MHIVHTVVRAEYVLVSRILCQTKRDQVRKLLYKFDEWWQTSDQVSSSAVAPPWPPCLLTISRTRSTNLPRICSTSKRKQPNLKNGQILHALQNTKFPVGIKSNYFFKILHFLRIFFLLDIDIIYMYFKVSIICFFSTTLQKACKSLQENVRGKIIL